ncbi:C3 and PZP-like alpha-2-macroglobulin domain-containing protein 8 [Mytilus edulis]|uniref:C3 and PZP-like alpha-2-macroglobulin domain-containing protein 8 n=1 Tax=Mytilus edulis TaxID=6550 RepID=UPI0039F05A4D
MASGQRLFLLTIIALNSLGLVIENTFTTPNNGKLNLFQVADFLQYVVDINQCGLDLGGITTLTFEAKACGDANTIMSNSDNGNSSKPIYEFIIGGWENQKSAILRRNDDSLTQSSQQVVIFNTPDICKCDEYRQFWISANNGVLMMGKGLIVGINVIAEWTDPDPFTVKSIGIITWGGIGEWKVQLEGNIVSFS